MLILIRRNLHAHAVLLTAKVAVWEQLIFTSQVANEFRLTFAQDCEFEPLVMQFEHPISNQTFSKGLPLKGLILS